MNSYKTSEEWLQAIPTNMLYEPIDPLPIDEVGLFYSGALHMVVAPPKHGKTHNTLAYLNTLNRPIYWIDADGNPKRMAEQFKNVIHLPLTQPCKFVQDWLSKKIDEPMIFVIDSLEKFSCRNNSNDNDGMVAIMNQFLHLKSNGSTVILIHHLKVSNYQGNDSKKLRGNESVIQSNCDIIYEFERMDDLFRYTTIVSRIESNPNGKVIDIPDGEKLKLQLIKEIIDNGGSVNKRDFEKKHKNHQSAIRDLISKGELITVDEKQPSGQPKMFIKVPLEKVS